MPPARGPTPTSRLSGDREVGCGARCSTGRSCLPGLPARVGSWPSVAAHTAARRRHARCPKGPSSAPRAAMSAFVHLSELAAASSSSNGVPQRAWRAAQTRRCRRSNSRAAGACLQPQQDGATSSKGASSAPVQRNKSRITAEAATCSTLQQSSAGCGPAPVTWQTVSWLDLAAESH